MEVECRGEPLPIQRCLVLNALIKKAGLSHTDYDNYLIVSELDNPEENDQIPEAVLYGLNVWLRQFGSQSFRDLAHLQRIADLIQRAYWAKQGKGTGLDLVEGHDLDAWLAQCDENRKFYMRLTDPDIPEDEDAIEAYNEKIGKSIWKKPWKKVSGLIT